MRKRNPRHFALDNRALMLHNPYLVNCPRLADRERLL
jgi:hypothetical protein